MKIKFEGLCPHCKKKIELARDLPQEVIDQILERVKPVVKDITPEEAVETEEKQSAVDMDWVEETLAIIRWKPQTALTWLKFQVKAEGTDLTEVLNSLPKDKLKIFVDHISALRGVAEK